MPAAPMRPWPDQQRRQVRARADLSGRSLGEGRERGTTLRKAKFKSETLRYSAVSASEMLAKLRDFKGSPRPHFQNIGFALVFLRYGRFSYSTLPSPQLVPTWKSFYRPYPGPLFGPATEARAFASRLWRLLPV